VVSFALLIIDHERLQADAWQKLHAAQKKLERASRALHQHEELDTPAYRRWLHLTFPELMTHLRELHEAVLATARKIQAVQTEAFFYGGTEKNIWREHRARGTAVGAADKGAEANQGDDEDEDFESTGYRDPDVEPSRGVKPSGDARAIYRRLVQHLHPDRGGEWTAVRERLWHEVQEAWAAGDADWLARLEVDWETANDVLGPKSPLSRLLRATQELDAARRDLERKVRGYRIDPAWRFTRTEKSRPALHQRVQRRLQHDAKALQDQLEHLQRTIAAWEDDWTRPKRRRMHRRG